jgi:hypothetical protein
MKSRNDRGSALLQTVPLKIKEGFKVTIDGLRMLGPPKWRIKNGRTSTVHERSTVKVTGPKIRNLKCTMCQGYIKVGLQYAQCDCGENYHVVCLARTGFCPICNKKWEEKDIVSISKTNGDSCSSPTCKKLECPSCGEHVSILDLECKCGAIFVKDNDSFLCPECGGRVCLSDMVCLSCGERFRDCEIVTCPVCGRRFDAMEGACTCGTFVGDMCPECGCRLENDDSWCPRCGAKIDAVEL